MPKDSEARFDRIFLASLFAILALAGLALKGLSGPIDLTGSWDELTYHYPSALHLANLPFPESLRDYPSATGPVAYLLAQLARPARMDLIAIRWLTVLITFLLGLTIYRLLVDRGNLDRRAGALFTGIALVSPYCLGGTFLFMTDNYAWLFVMAWAYFLTGYLRLRDLSHFNWSILFLSFAICTRQTTAWIIPITAYAAWRTPEHRWRGLGMIVLGCLLLAALGWLWHGPTPPSAIGRHTGIGGSYLRAATMGLTTLGFFAAFFLPWTDVQEYWRTKHRSLAPWLALLGSLALLIAAPLAGDSRGAPRNSVHIDGYLLKLLDHGPRIADSYLLYGPFIFLGVLTLLIATHRGHRFAVASLVCAIGIHLSNKIVYERYFDLLVLVCLAWIFGDKWQEVRWRIALLGLFFFAHPFFRHRVSPTPFQGLDTSMYSTDQAADLRNRFVPQVPAP